MTIPDEFESWCALNQIENTFCTRAKLYLNELINKAIQNSFREGMRYERSQSKIDMQEMLGGIE